LLAEAPYAKLFCSKLVREGMTRMLAINQVDVAIDITLALKTPIKYLNLSSDAFCILLSKNHQEADNITPDIY